MSKDYKNRKDIDIYVEVEGIGLNLSIDASIVKDYGGIDEVKESLRWYVCSIMGDLSAPVLKKEVGQINQSASREKMRLLESLCSEEKSVSWN